jgi:isoleucyl-tRNA synthetase
VAADKLVTVAIDTTLTPELKAEGLVREVVRHIQTQRKNANFNIEDRIWAWYVAPDEWVSIFADWSEYIQSETLTTELIAGEPPADAFVQKHTIDGKEITIGVKRNEME